ncbi:MAG: outer membrane lipoprotein carrier protein LolA [Acidobacteriota bacterium]
MRATFHHPATLLLLGTLVSGAAQAAPAPPDPAVQELLRRFEEARGDTRTLTGKFRQVKEDDLFAEAEESEGTFHYTRPDLFRWESQDQVLLATRDKVMHHVPSLAVLEERDISRNRRRVVSYFGLNGNIAKLQKRFDVTAAEKDGALVDGSGPSPYPEARHVVLEGRKRRIKKRIGLIELWLLEDTGLPRAVRLTMADGGITTWEFSEMKANVEIPETVYTLTVPDSTVRREGVTAMNQAGAFLEELEDDEDTTGAKGSTKGTKGGAMSTKGGTVSTKGGTVSTKGGTVSTKGAMSTKSGATDARSNTTGAMDTASTKDAKGS